MRLSFLGATLLLLALWLAGVSLFLGVSWLASWTASGGRAERHVDASARAPVPARCAGKAAA